MNNILTNKDFLLLADYIIHNKNVICNIDFKYMLLKKNKTHNLVPDYIMDLYTVVIDKLSIEENNNLNLIEITNELNSIIYNNSLMGIISVEANHILAPFTYRPDSIVMVDFLSYLLDINPMDFNDIIKISIKNTQHIK